MNRRGVVALCLTLACAAGAAAQPVVVVAAGDLACDPADANYQGGAGTASACRMAATSALALALDPGLVLVLGDNQYENGALAKYQVSYEASWGRLKGLTRPVPGNHDYGTAGAAGYFSYFGPAAGDPTQGYYSYDLGNWHLVALNSNCAAVGGCVAGSPQETWLAADLAASASKCTLAYWHHPRFSSGGHGSDPTYDAFWQDLHAAGADLVLNAHDHVYERFAPQDPTGAADPARGLRQLTVGTGGKNLTAFQTIRANSEERRAGAFGALRLDLHPQGYAWSFVDLAGSTLDQGSALCHRALPAATGGYYTVAPCRLLDTRRPVGASGGPALAAGETRSFPVGGACGVPVDAVAVAVNVTVVEPTASGHLTLYPAGGPQPGTSNVNFRTRTRAASAVLALGVAGQATAHYASAAPAGSAHLVLDVAGYFR